MMKKEDHLYILHVQEPAMPVMTPDFYGLNDGLWLAEAEKHNRDAGIKLLQRFGQTAKLRNVHFTLLLAHGDPKDRVVEECKDKKIDTLFVGRRALGGLDRLFQGSYR